MIGLWLFTELVAALLIFRNQPAGTLDVKNISVILEVYKSFFIENVIRAIRDKCPGDHPFTMNMDQDNAPIRCRSTIPDVMLECASHRIGSN